MTEQDSSRQSPEAVEAALAAFTEAWFAGEKHDPGAFCKDHPECGPELRERIDDFIFVAGAFPRDGGSGAPGLPDDGAAAGRLIGDFRIVSRIGSGGMGEVFEAEQISLHRRVALKVLPSHLSLSDTSIRKFRREAMAGGRQSHPGIVAVHAVGEHGGIHFIAQELVGDGVTLADRIAKYRSADDLPVGYFRHAARVTAEVADALGHAHASGVIHRDVKPSNILLTPEGEPKVTDFGLARIEDGLGLTRTGDLMGTPFYMSPEQADSGRGTTDERTDVFSLGVTLYEVLTLSVPFDGKTSREVLRKVLLAEPRDPGKVNPRVPRELAVICLKAIEKEKGRRYASMGELAADLRRFLNGEPIVARPAGTVTRVVKRVRRYPALSAAVGFALVAAVVGLILVWQVERSGNLSTARIVDEWIKRSVDSIGSDPGEAIDAVVGAAERARQLSEMDPALKLSLNNTAAVALRNCHELKTIPTGAGDVAVFGPEEELVFVILDDGSLAAWDWISCEKTELGFEPGEGIEGLSFSPQGGLLALRAWDEETGRGMVRLVDTSSRMISDVLSGEWRYRDLAFSSDGRYLAIPSEEMVVRIIDTASRTIVREITGFGWYPTSASFGNDGSVLAIGCEDGNVTVLELGSSGDPLILGGVGGAVKSVQFDPTQGSRELLVLYTNGQAVLHDTRSRKGDAVPVNNREKEPVLKIAFSPGGGRIAAIFKNHTVRLIDLPMVKNLRRVLSGSSSERLSSIERLMQIEAIMDDRVVAEFEGHGEPVRCVAASRDGEKYVTVSKDGTTRIWGIDPGILSMPVARGWKVEAISPDGSRFAVASSDRREIAVYDTCTKRRIRTPARYESLFEIRKADTGEEEIGIYRIPDSTAGYRFAPVKPGGLPGSNMWFDDSQVKKMSFSGCGRILAANFTRNIIKIWNLSSERLIAQFMHNKDISGIRCSPDGTRLAVALTDNSLFFLSVSPDAGNGRRVGRHAMKIKEIVFSSDGSRVATSSVDGAVVVRDCGSAAAIARFRLPGTTEETDTLLAFSHDGRFLAAAAAENGIRIFGIDSGDELDCSMIGHDRKINTIEFGTDDSCLLTASDDGTARIWPLQRNAEPIVLHGHVGGASFAIPSPDGRYVLTGSKGGGARLWSAPEGQLLLEIYHDLPVIYGAVFDRLPGFVTAPVDGPVLVAPFDPIELARSRNPRAAYRLASSEIPAAEIEENRNHRLSGSSDESETDDARNETSGEEAGHDGDADRCLWHWSEVDIEKIRPSGKSEPVVFMLRERAPEGEDGDTPGFRTTICLFDPVEGFPFERLHALGHGDKTLFATDPAGGRICLAEQRQDKRGGLRGTDIGRLRFREDQQRESMYDHVVGIGRLKIDRIDWLSPHLVCIGTRDPDNAVHNDAVEIIDLDGDGTASHEVQTVLRRPGQFFGSPSISSSGKSICFLHFAGVDFTHDWEIWTADLTDDLSVVRPRQLTDNRVSDTKCRFGAGSNDIYSIRARDQNGGGRVWVVRRDPATDDEDLLFEIGEYHGIRSMSISSGGLIVLIIEDEKMENPILHFVNPALKTRATVPFTDSSGKWREIYSPRFIRRTP